MTINHPPSPKTALWVYAHPHRETLNGHLFEEGSQALSEQFQVLTSELYTQQFDPVLSDRDLGGDARRGSIVELNAEAFANGSAASDVREEQAKLAAAELLVIQFPLWWYGPPAILKGWLDRVLTAGFAFGDLDPELGVPRRYGDGGLTRRRALVIVTAGEDARSIGARGISGDLETLLFPLTHGALWYVGIEALDLHVVYDADTVDSDRLSVETERLTERIRDLGSERVHGYRRLADGDYSDARALRADIHPGRTDLGIHRIDAHSAPDYYGESCA